MALPGGRKPIDRASSFRHRPSSVHSIQYIESVHSARSFRALSFALCKGLRPLHPRTALARCPPSLAPLPGAQAGGMRTGQTQRRRGRINWPRSLAPSLKGGIGR